MSPEQAATIILAAADAGDWDTVTRWVDPDALASFYADELGRVRLAEGAAREAAEMPDEPPPGMPPEVFAWFHRPREHVSWLRAVYGVDTLADLEAWPPAQLLARYLRTKHPRAAEGGRRPRREVLGVVHEGPELAHVVFRVPIVHPDAPAGLGATVLTLRWREERWGCLLNGDLVYDAEGGTSLAIMEVPELPDAAASDAASPS